MTNTDDPFDPLNKRWPYNINSIESELDNISKSTNESLERIRNKQNKSDEVIKRIVPKHIKRIAKSLDNPLPTNPNMLWEVKRQNHKLLKTTKDPKLREKMVQEIIEADQQIIKNIDQETEWMTTEKERINKQIDEENKGKKK